MAENYGSLEGVLDANETLEGEIDSHDEMSGEIQFSGGVGGVKDVQVNNESVVDANKVAHIDLTPYAEKEDVYDKQTIDTALESKADTDDIPTDLSDLQDDSNHRLVTDEEKTEWSGKADTSDIPTALSQLDNDDNYVQDADYQHTDNNFTDEDKAAIGNIPENITDLSDVAVNNIQNGQVLKWDATQEKFVNANESGGSGDVTDVKVNNASVVDAQGVANIDLTGYAEKSDLGTASSKDVPATGNAGANEVVLGNDTRLSDSRPASDVSAWAKESTKPSYTKSEVGLDNVDNTSDSTKKTNFTGSIASGDTGFTTGGDVYTALGGKADKVSGATDGHIAGLDANGNLTDSGLAATTIVHKADKVSGQVAGHLASLSGTGNLADSGWNGAKGTTSISGNPISITGLKSNQLAISPIITLEPIQAGSGTPSPSNIRAISGYDKIEVLSVGKNVLPATVENIKALNTAGSWSGNVWTIYTGTITLLTNDNGEVIGVKANGTFTSTVIMDVGLGTLPQGTYKLSGITGGSGTTYDMRVYNMTDGGQIGNDLFDGDLTFTLNGTKVVRARIILRGSVNISNITFYPMIREGSQINTYEPYHKATSISESLGQTVYWLTHTVRTGIAKILGQLLVNPQNLDWHEGSRNVFCAALTSGVGNGWSSHYAFSNLPYQTMDNLTWYTQNNYIYVRNTNYGGNVSGFAASLNDVQFVYPLATPTEIQLTPHEISLLKDYAYVSTNGTSIALDYHNGELASLADTAQIGESLNALGKYVNNKKTTLYKSTLITGSTTLSYTGVSVTVPSDKFYALDFYIVYNNSAPQEIAVATASSGSLEPHNTLARTDKASHVYLCGKTTGDTTFYIWGKWSGAYNNNVRYVGWYE